MVALGRIGRTGNWALICLFCAANPLWTPAASADAPLFPGRERVTEAQLDRIRGGFVLPNGMDVSIGIQIDTLVNGTLALRTMLTAGDSSKLSVFAGDASAAAQPASASTTESGDAATLPGGGTIRVVQGPVPETSAGAGQQEVALTPNGPSAMTQWGSVRLEQNDRGAVVVLSGSSLELHHMIGSFTGTLVANAANDRSIDTIVTVNVDLHNSAVPVGNAMLRWESIALDAAGRGIH